MHAFPVCITVQTMKLFIPIYTWIRVTRLTSLDTKQIKIYFKIDSTVLGRFFLDMYTYLILNLSGIDPFSCDLLSAAIKTSSFDLFALDGATLIVMNVKLHEYF